MKHYGAATAVGPLTLAVPRSKTVALIGPSGAGKSTVLRIVMGLIHPDSGQVRFRGAPTAPVDDLSRRRMMGYVVQGGGLFPHLSARDNVALVARFLRWAGDRIAARISDLAMLCRLSGDALARYPAELSGGQRQRVSLMRALMLDPEVLLLDEPLGALDPMTRSELQGDLRRIFGELSKTVVLVTHDLAEAAFFAHRIVLLRDGRLVQEGTLAEMHAAPAEPFVTRFIEAQAIAPPTGEGP